MVEIVKNVKTNEWNDFINNINSSTIYHTPEWRLFLVKTFNYDQKYLFAKDDTGKITGMLPLFYIKSRITGNRLCSSPFSHICGAIGNQESNEELINEAIKLHNALGTNYLEVRDNLTNPAFKSQNLFSTYILDLSTDPLDVWGKLDKGSVRWAVKKSQKNGVKVIKTNNPEDILKFYELNRVTKKELGVPCHPLAFINNLFIYMNKYLSLYISIYDNDVIGGGIMEYFKDAVLYGYGAANPNYLKQYPYNAFIWKSIEDACNSGYKHYDFGRTSYDNRGLSDFKSRWNTYEQKLFYSYFPDKKYSVSDNRSSLKYNLTTDIIKKSPMILYSYFSEGIFKHFG